MNRENLAKLEDGSTNMVSINAKSVAASVYHTMVLTQEGSVYATGENGIGQLGDGSTSDKNFFVKVFSSDAKAIAAGDTYSMIVRRDGSLWASGRNTYGQFGDGNPSYEVPPERPRFVKIVPGGVDAVSAGGAHSIIVKEDGSLWASGDNEFGQLGDRSTTSRRIFAKVISAGATATGAGSWHSLMLQQDGSVWATGRNTRGQLGDGTTTDRHSFIKIISSGATAVAAGNIHSMVLKQDGSLWATGANDLGQLGDPMTAGRNTLTGRQRTVFTKVIPSDVKTVSTRSVYSVALKHDGSMWIAGNQYSSNPRREFEVEIFGGVTAVAAGDEYSIMVQQDGTVWASGKNDFGQLGDGSKVSTWHGKAFVQGQCQGKSSGPCGKTGTVSRKYWTRHQIAALHHSAYSLSCVCL